MKLNKLLSLFSFCLFLGFCLLSVSCSSHDHSVHGKHKAQALTANEHLAKHSFERMVSSYENPKRKDWQKPELVVEALGDLQDKVLADIGAGTGYFIFRLAPKAKKVFAVDIDQRFLDYIEDKNAELETQLPIETILATEDEANLPQGLVDIVLIVNTYHHIQERVLYLQRLGEKLKPNAKIMIVDFKDKELPVGPPKQYRLSVDEVRTELEEAGYGVVSADAELLPYQYVVVAQVGVEK